MICCGWANGWACLWQQNCNWTVLLLLQFDELMVLMLAALTQLVRVKPSPPVTHNDEG